MNISRKLNQTAVYWAPTGSDGFGKPTFASAVEIACRWEEVSDLFTDDTGQEARSFALVFTNTDLLKDGYLYLGEQADLDSNHDDPTVIDNAWPIRRVDKIPNLRGTQFLRKAWL